MLRFYTIILTFCISNPVSGQLPDITMTKYGTESGLPSYQVMTQSLEDGNGHIWIATDRGLFRFDGYEFKPFLPDVNDSTSIIDVAIYCLLEDEDGGIWIGTQGDGVNRYDPKTGQFDRMRGSPFDSLRIWSFHMDDENGIWLAARGGLGYIDRKSGNMALYVPDSTFEENQRIFRFIVADSTDSDKLWLGSLRGLLSFNKVTRQFQYHGNPEFRRGEHRNFLLMEGVLINNDNLYMGCWGQGVARYTISTQTWDTIQIPPKYTSVREGWNNIVLSLAPFNDSIIWIASCNGFGTLNVNTERYSFYGHDTEALDGFPKYFCYEGTSLTRQNNIVFGASYGPGVAISSPTHAYSGDYPYELMLTSIHIEGREQIKGPEYVERITIHPHEQAMHLTMSLPDYRGLGEVQYAYKLDGRDKDWIQTGQMRRLSLTGLKSGSYEFHYKAKPVGYDWITGNSTLKIRRSVHFWQHPLFAPVIAVFVIGIMTVFYWMRIKSIRKEAALKTEFSKKITEIELAALRAQMNPHFMFNSLNSIKYYILKQKNDEASKYLTKFSQLMRSILRDSKSKLICLSDELHSLTLYLELESLRFIEHEFHFSIDTSDIPDTSSIYTPPLIIQPYVENAVWHGLLHKKAPGNIWIRAFICNSALVIEIEDDGIGRKAAKKINSKSATRNKSYGLQITSDRIELIKTTYGIDADVQITDLYANDGSASGTKVTLRLPMITEAEMEQIIN